MWAVWVRLCDISLNVCQLLSSWGIICSPQTGLKLINDAAWKDLFRVQSDKLSQIDSEDHMSAGYRDILTGPRLCVSEKLYPAFWRSSFFSLMPWPHTPLLDGEFMSTDETPGQKLQWYFMPHVIQDRLDNRLVVRASVFVCAQALGLVAMWS